MDVKVTVKGPHGRHIEHVNHVSQEGDLARVIGEALDIYRRFYPDAPPFRRHIEIEEA